MQKPLKSIIRKSNSISHFKNIEQSKIIFNPAQFEVGQSKVQRLPQKIMTRRFSQPSLPRTEKHINSREPKQLQTSLLMKINQKLSKQNKQLKKQLQLYKRISSSSKIKNNFMQDKITARRDLRNIVVEKINRTKCSSRLQSQTGLYSSKQISSYHQFESISQMYENFIKKSIKPTFIAYQQQLKKFFTEIEQTYIKLKYLFESFQRNQIISYQQYEKSQNILKSINQICQIKIQQEKINKYPGLAQKSRTKLKVQRQPTREKSQKMQKQDPLQLLSPQQVVQRFEKYILKVMRSQKILKSLKANLVVRKFTKKLSEV